MLFYNASLKNDNLNASKIVIFLKGLASLLIIGNYSDEESYEDVSPSFLNKMMEDTPNYPFTSDEEGFEVNIGIPFRL
ncbi:hypothetical protein [Legionella pneumophila]|uniref:Uncharacterized protein n=1 Tax=Legionella pneumophila subsp. pascullei TaxID=91890 RepID=A0AAX2IZ35_LEGPN|nr:hypothetical protein [Legionella pneumophila]AMP90780.1 hypothetical protein AXF35_14210 [Legionella pneumophila subsp. pascullei]AMP93764.1 hypothetical protein AXF36_14575 [Legionella pneumophila subsp. pascullei]AMP96681.1 hypothetical protein AXF37_14210 [Legionella pneumophila subsp. pascullei]SQG91727.1 Uncharacterised protein [Legionella pneumophila subsp. pascullei]VEH08273.1 Uncharacterised protein [Legionella pneumophila subsp. pascullei]